jgi:hemerythrin superfamily protein
MDATDERLDCTGVFAALKLEHAQLGALMAELAGTTADDEDLQERRRELFARIRAELLSHAAAEEVTFYARLKSKPETSAQIDESIDEHQRMEDLVEELDKLGTDSR